MVDVTKEGANKLTFNWKKEKDGPEIPTTVADYFAQQYHPLKFPGLPCLWVGTKSRSNYIPLEVAVIRHGQKSSKKLTEDQTSIMIKVVLIFFLLDILSSKLWCFYLQNVCWEAPLREQKINEMVHAAGFSEDPFAKQFGLKLNPKMADVNGRVIAPPTLGYKNATSQLRDGTWKQSGKFFSGAEVPLWALMSFVPQQRQSDLELVREIK